MPAFVIGFAIMSYLLATDMFTPSMPDIAHYFNAPDDQVQKTISYFLMGAVITCINAGIFADRIGKKKFMTIGLGLALIGSLLTLTATSLEWLIFGRFIQGLGGGAAPVIGFAMVQELYPREQQTKIYAFLGSYIAIIPAIAPFIGGVISTQWGWHLIFPILTVLFLISIIGVWWVLPSSLDQKKSHSAKEILSSYKMILSSRTYLTFALILPLYNAVEWFYITFLPFYMQERIGISPELYGVIIGVLICLFAVGSYLGPKFVKPYGTHRTIQIGLYCGVIAGVSLWVTVAWFPLSVIGILFPLAIYLIGFGMLFTTTVSSALDVFAEARTRASSIRSMFITSFAFMGSYMAELMDDSNLSRLAIFVTICTLLALLVYEARPKKDTSE